MKKVLVSAAAATVSLSLVTIVGAGVASAKGRPTPVVASGTTICNFHGSLSAAAGATVSMKGNLTPHHGAACSNSGASKLRNGHLLKDTLVSTATTTGVCTLLAGGSLPDLAGGTIRWSPGPKVAPSTGVAFTGGTVTVVTVGSDSFLQIVYSGGSVAGGSFTNGTGAALTLTSRATVAELTTDCAAGPVTSLAVSGSMTL